MIYENEPNNTSLNATLISLDTTVSGGLSSYQDIDWFRVLNLSAGTYTFKPIATSIYYSANNTYGVISPSDVVLARGVVGPYQSTWSNFTLTANSDIYIQIINNYSPTTYQFEVAKYLPPINSSATSVYESESNNSLTTADIVLLGDKISASLPYGDVDYFKYQVNATGLLHFKVDLPAGSGAKWEFSVFDSSGQIVNTFTGWGNARAESTEIDQVVNPGIYYLKAVPVFTSSSMYSVTVNFSGNVTGTAGNDLIVLKAASNNLVNGYAGIDVVSFDTSFDTASINSGNKVSFNDGVDDYSTTLTNVERLQFTDYNVAFDADGANSAGGIYRLYQAAFDRKPDLPGLGYWIKAADNGKSAVTMGEDFTWSKEFLDLFHLTTPKDNYFTGVDVKTLVDGIYQHVLHRAPDSGGLNYYSGVIQSHEKTVGRVLAEISDSPENHTAVASSIADGIQYTPYTAQAMTSQALIEDVQGSVELVGQAHNSTNDLMWIL